MCECEDHFPTFQPLTFETMLSDPLIRLVMQSDGIGLAEMTMVLEVAREAVLARALLAARVTGPKQMTRVRRCQFRTHH